MRLNININGEPTVVEKTIKKQEPKNPQRKPNLSGTIYCDNHLEFDESKYICSIKSV